MYRAKEAAASERQGLGLDRNVKSIRGMGFGLSQLGLCSGLLGFGDGA